MGDGPHAAAVLAGQAEDFVDDDVGDCLARPLRHEACFVRIYLEAFFANDPAGSGTEFVRGGSIHIAGEGEIIRVTGICEPGFFREAGETSITSATTRPTTGHKVHWPPKKRCTQEYQRNVVGRKMKPRIG